MRKLPKAVLGGLLGASVGRVLELRVQVRDLLLDGHDVPRRVALAAPGRNVLKIQNIVRTSK